MTTSSYAPRFDIRVAGLTMAAELAEQVLSMTVETSLDLAGSFGFVLRNPDNALLDSPLLDPGKTVEIHLGYGNDLKPAFLGEIAAVEPSFPQSGPPTVQVSGYDRSYRMRRGQPEPTEYTFMNDSLVAARIAVENGLVPVVDPTPGVKEKIIQVESDMAFLKDRARRYHFDVYVEWDRMYFRFPRPQAAAHVLEWGRNLSSFTPRVSASAAAGLQVVRGYNQELAQTVQGLALAADLGVDRLTERLGGGAADLLLAMARKGVRRHSLENPLDAKVLAQSLLAELLDGMYEGSGSCVGVPGLSAGQFIEIRGVGKRFSGTYRLRKVTHRIDEGGFMTDFSISQGGHSSLLGMLRKQIVEEPPPNRTEPFYGVVLGVVEDNHEVTAVPPKAPLGRVKVSFPGLSDRFTGGWAPCARPMAGKDMGFYWLPEPGDQVLVAFDQGDLGKPYVIGGLWNADQPPPATNTDGSNSTRVIKSRSGHTITFDDAKSGGEVVIRDGGRGSAITLNAADGSLTISAAGDLSLTAGGDVTLTAAGRTTTITAGSSVELAAAQGATKLVVSETDVNIT
ncbi:MULTISPECIES: phage baseplate assembly protein V [Streptomyces]|uniref:phage baseplate assembly protein V n=1 Tax=Streptomyces TaxID=1883 RepID=UPI000F54D930|nr:MULTISPECIES: phage baseplate assembly protein V [Streptomyces]RPK33032.1 Phage late control gene D protein (GPD) [Streptomyces sp. ADI91-18]WSS02480.1 phage baseplate assembly protein V [Streptomyces goshikiensis]